MLQGQTGPKSSEEKTILNALKRLNRIDSQLPNLIDKIKGFMDSKMTDKILDESNLGPMISLSDKFMIVPKTFNNEDYHIAQYMVAVADKLGIGVYTLRTDPKLREVPAYYERIGSGIMCSLLDGDKRILARQGKKDDIELGRSIARGQQIVRIFSSGSLGQDALTPNHFFFGNNPGEKKENIKVTYFAKEMGNLFEETDYAEDLRKMLITLLRESAAFLTDDQKDQMVKEYLITRDLLINKYCAAKKIETIGSGKRKMQVKVRRLPHKPRASPLLTKNEAAIISQLSSNVFTQPSSQEKDDWFEFVTQNTFSKVRSRLREDYVTRSNFLEKYAQLTTSRLGEFKRSHPTQKQKKKREFSSQELETLLSKRTDPYYLFSVELSKIDPKFEHFLSRFRVENTKRQLLFADSCKELITYLESIRVYDEEVIIEDPDATQDFSKKDRSKRVGKPAPSAVNSKDKPKVEPGLAIEEIAPDPKEDLGKEVRKQLDALDPEILGRTKLNPIVVEANPIKVGRNGIITITDLLKERFRNSAKIFSVGKNAKGEDRFNAVIETFASLSEGASQDECLDNKVAWELIKYNLAESAKSRNKAGLWKREDLASGKAIPVTSSDASN